MTNQQGEPEALRLADALASNYFDGKHGRNVWDAAAAELRHLHAENERLAALVEAQQPAPSAAAEVKLEQVHGDVLPPVGSRVFIRHGRDDDAHVCIVTGYYAWGDLHGDKRLHRVFVRMVYEGTTTEQARMLCDCYPTAEAALAPQPSPTPQADSQPAPAKTKRFNPLEGGNAETALQMAAVIALRDSQPAPVRDYPPLPNFDSGDEPIWNAIFNWKTATPGPDAHRKANAVESAIINQLRAYVDADRAARAPADSVTAPAGGATAEPRWKSEDFEVTHYPPMPTTGMRVGMPRGVKVTHRPTGLFAVSEDERSQHRNREVAWNKLQEMLAAPTPPAQAADSVLEDAASAGFFLQLPQRPKPAAPAGTVGLDWDAYSGAQMLAYGRDCSNAAIVATQKTGGL